MKSNKNILKHSIIQIRNNLNQKDIEKNLTNKKTKNNDLDKDFIMKNKKEEKILRNAYKKVITVITNILDNIEEAKANGKINALGTHRIMENKNKIKIKKPIKKLISYDISKINYSLDIPKLKESNSYESSQNINNSLIMNKSPLKLGSNWKLNNFFINDNNFNNAGSINGKNTSSFNKEKYKKRVIYKRFKKKNLNQFFTPKNRLISKWNSSKNIIDNSPKNKLIKKPIINKSSIDINNRYNSSISSSSLKNSYIFESRKNINSILDKNMNNQLNISSFNSSNPFEEQKDNKNNNIEPMSPFNKIQTKIQITDTDDNTSHNLFETNNSEITNETNNPISEKLINTKKKKEIKRMLSPSKYNKIDKIVSLKPLRGILAKTFNKEKKYRHLLSKGYIYDSLDDEEESDEEEINNCYFEPDSKFLYILDSLTLISSFIILFFLPIHLAKRLFFCHNFRNTNIIIFYFIDFIYIFDLIINFYRSYYNLKKI